MTTLLVRPQAMHQAQSVQRHTSALLDSWRNMDATTSSLRIRCVRSKQNPVMPGDVSMDAP